MENEGLHAFLDVFTHSKSFLDFCLESISHSSGQSRLDRQCQDQDYWIDYRPEIIK
jgi:hypothetical protein